jgi:acyl-CoA dehydrogenase
MKDQAFLNLPLFGAEQRSLARRLRDWIAANRCLLDARPGDDDASIDAHCRELVRRLGADGFLGNCVPGDYSDDAAIPVRNLCLCRETLAYESGLADFAFAMQGLGSGPISIFGSPDLKQHYLPQVMAGTCIAAFAVSEQAAGSDVGAITTTATKDDDDYVLNGAKTWISNAGIADHYVVFARTGEGPGTRGLSAFVVDAATPGLSVSERIPVSAPHPLGSLRFENCRVPAAHMIGDPGDGFRVAMATLDVFRASVGAAALGFARRALDEAVARSKERTAFGQNLARFQITQAKLADMAVSIDAAALLIYRAAWSKDCAAGHRITREAAMAKLYATEEAQKVIDQAVQLFGGLGVVKGSVVESLYREIRALRIYEGTSEIQKLVIAADVLKGRDDA